MMGSYALNSRMIGLRFGCDRASIQSVFWRVPARLLVRACPYVLGGECERESASSQVRVGWELTREVDGGSDGTRTRDLRLDRRRRPLHLRSHEMRPGEIGRAHV